MTTPTRHFVSGPLLPSWIQEQMFLYGSNGLAQSKSAAKEQTQIGALASFQGIIRADSVNNFHVTAIEYSAYVPLAERLFSSMEDRIRQDYGLHVVRIWHSLGVVKTSECSMLVLAASGHRAEAFDGLRAAVEAVKAEAPIWKREMFASGEYRWVEGPVSSLFDPEFTRTNDSKPKPGGNGQH